MSSNITINAWKSGFGGYQLSIEDEATGIGYRLSGNKFCGNSTLLTKRDLDKRDIKEIRSFLNTASKRLKGDKNDNIQER